MSRRWSFKVIDARGRGKEIPIDKLPLEIGRDPSVTIPVEDQQASRRHCRIEKTDAVSLWLVDLDSSNGTFLNGRRIKRGKLEHGATFKVGDTHFTLIAEDLVIMSDDGANESMFKPENRGASAAVSRDRGNKASVLLSKLFSGESATKSSGPAGAEKVLLTLLAGVTDTFPLQRAAVLLRTSGKAALSPVISYLKETVSGGIVISRTIAHHVFVTGEAVIVAEPAADPRFYAAQSVHHINIGHVVAVPMYSGEERLGVLYATTSQEWELPISEDDLACLTRLAKLIGEFITANKADLGIEAG